MMDCNWLVRDTEQKRQELIKALRVQHKGDLESEVRAIHAVSQMSRAEILVFWKDL